MALQDDFSHPTTYLLTLFSCVKHYYTTEELERWEPAVTDPDEVTSKTSKKYSAVLQIKWENRKNSIMNFIFLKKYKSSDPLLECSDSSNEVFVEKKKTLKIIISGLSQNKSQNCTLSAALSLYDH